MISVVLPAHNPEPRRLARTLAGLRAQSLPVTAWELVIVDNASVPPLAALDLAWHPRARVVVETKLGLTPARLRGVQEGRGDVVVFVDDDNVLDPAYLASVARRFAEHPRLGAAGGPVVPEFESPAPEWTREFWGLLALQDHGPVEHIAIGGPKVPWPTHAPVGAGLCVRRAALEVYIRALDGSHARRQLDRTGASLASGGDNDLVFTLHRAGWDVGYFPELRVTHLIPPGRLDPAYLARLNAGIQRTWVRVLAIHDACPWAPIAPWTLSLRTARAWWRERAWSSPVHRIRWHGRAGRFAGQADLSRL